MARSYSTALAASRLLLKIGRVLNLMLVAALIAMLVASFVFEPLFRDFFTVRPATAHSRLLMPILRIWVVVSIPAMAAFHLLVSRLLEMVETVRVGDPFVPENAVRLRTIAWCMLALQLFNLACGVLAAAMNAAGSRIDWTFSATGWVAVALLFVLAQVFEQGTRIRADLEAMI